MKTLLRTTLVVSLLASATTFLPAQGGPGGPGGGTDRPLLGGGMVKLFGEQPAFSGMLENQIKVSDRSEAITMAGKVAYDSGKSRFEMNLSETKGTGMPAEMAGQMKAMGMDKTIAITRPDKKLSYLIYPDLKAYAETPLDKPEQTKPESAYKVEVTELGKETVDGHPAIKNKAIVTDDQGNKQEFTVWNATDMKKFPIKLETTDQRATITMQFKDVKFGKPDAALFEAPTDYKKYTDAQAMMREQLMKHMGGGMGGGMGGPPPR